MELVKLICERQFPHGPLLGARDVRVFHSEPQYAEQIAAWFEERGYTVSREEV